VAVENARPPASLHARLPAQWEIRVVKTKKKKNDSFKRERAHAVKCMCFFDIKYILDTYICTFPEPPQ